MGFMVVDSWVSSVKRQKKSLDKFFEIVCRGWKDGRMIRGFFSSWINDGSGRGCSRAGDIEGSNSLCARVRVHDHDRRKE